MAEYADFTVDDGERIAKTVRAHEAGSAFPPDRNRRLKDRDFNRIQFRNDAVEEVPGFAVMRVTGVVTVNSVIRYKIEKPNTTFQRLYLVNSRNAVGAGGYGWGTWLWHADWVLYDDASTPAFGEEWGAKADEWKLFQNRPGFLIRGGETGEDDDARVLAIQQLVTSVFVQADAPIVGGSSGTVRVYGGTPGSETDTGQTIESVFNPNSLTADENDEATVTWLHGKPYLFPIC